MVSDPGVLDLDVVALMTALYCPVADPKRSRIDSV